MPAEGNALYSQDLFLLTLKGWITIQFLDGHTLEGEFVTQDTLNIFLTVEGEPFMIPRSQIRYIKGRPGQQVEEDTSQKALASPKPEPSGPLFDTKMPKTAEMPPSWQAEAELPQTEPAAAPGAYDDDGGTFVIESGSMADLYSSTQEADLPGPNLSDLDDTGLTFVLDDTADLHAPDADATIVESPDLDFDDATVLLDQSEEELTAQLMCTDGPHAGEIFQLRGGVVTLGRATDNDVALPNDKEISRRHAIIARDMGKFMIQDQNSLNGTFVNEVRIDSPYYLENGDIILIGVSHLEYQEK